jgi:large subunit ribosomal protein L24
MMSVHLNETLRKRYGKRNFPIHKGDNVKIMKGEFKGKTGKIDSVDLKKLRVMIDGIFRTKKDGTKVSVYFNPSNLLIKELNLEDEKRKNALSRVGKEKVGMTSSDLKKSEASKNAEQSSVKKFTAKPLPVEKKKDESKDKSKGDKK